MTICLVSVSKVHSKYSDTTTKILVGNKSLCYLFSLCHLFALMFSIQLMPLIQFNIYCTLHINNNINNNMIVIHLMPLIQFNVYYTLHSNTNNNRPSNNFLVIDFMLQIMLLT